MKRLWGFVCAAALVAGCGPDIDLAARPLFSNGVNTITFMVYDGFTGGGVDSAELRLLVGGYTVEAKREGNVYIVSQLPAGTFPTLIDAAGYLSFVGSSTVAGTGTLIPVGTQNSPTTPANPGPATQTYKTYQVVLYPESRVADNVVVNAYESEDGAPVASGTVIATLTSAQTFLGVTLDSLLPGTFTTRPSTLVASISAGAAVFPKEKLVLGGTYKFAVIGAANADGLYLTPNDDGELTVGEEFPNVTLFLGPPAQTPVAITANTEEEDAVLSSLVVTFPYPVEVCSELDDHDWSFDYRQQDPDDADYDLDDDGNITAPPSENYLTVSVSGTTVTVTPNFATGTGAFDAGDGEMWLELEGVGLRVVGSSSCVLLSNIDLRDSGDEVDIYLQINAAIE